MSATGSEQPSDCCVSGTAMWKPGGVCWWCVPPSPCPQSRLIPISSVIGMQPQSGGGRGIFGKKRQSSWELYSD